jgi:Leucine-rich repeat (LRR) protein
VLYLQNNKLKRIYKDIFKDLIQLRELSLESNELVAIDKSSFLNLNNLQRVCLNNNPITTLFSNDLLTFICTNHINCTVSLIDKCIRNYTLHRLNNSICSIGPEKTRQYHNGFRN